MPLRAQGLGSTVYLSVTTASPAPLGLMLEVLVAGGIGKWRPLIGACITAGIYLVMLLDGADR